MKRRRRSNDVFSKSENKAQGTHSCKELSVISLSHDFGKYASVGGPTGSHNGGCGQDTNSASFTPSKECASVGGPVGAQSGDRSPNERGASFTLSEGCASVGSPTGAQNGDRGQSEEEVPVHSVLRRMLVCNAGFSLTLSSSPPNRKLQKLCRINACSLRVSSRHL